MPRHKWGDVRGATINTPALEAEVAQEVALLALERRLFAMRQDMGVSQQQLAERLHVSQANVSRIEAADDLQVSTLARYIEALGGHLEVSAVFDGRAGVPLIEGKSPTT